MAAHSAVDAIMLHGFAALSARVSGFVDRDAALLDPLQSQLALHAEKLARLHHTAQLAENLREAVGELMDDANAVARGFRGERNRNAEFQRQTLAAIEDLRALVKGAREEFREGRDDDDMCVAQALEEERATSAEFQRRMLADVAAMRAEIDELRRARPGPY